MARECGGVVLPHNHPASVPPSYRDFLTAASEENVKASVILGHDGSVWFVSIPDHSSAAIADALEDAHNRLAAQYGEFAEVKAVDEIVSENEKRNLFDFRRLR